MANRYAVANGDWSNTATWDGGTLPTTSDDVYADGWTVTIDQVISVLSLRNSQRSGGTNGGQFIATDDNDITLTGTGLVISNTAAVSLVVWAGTGSLQITGPENLPGVLVAGSVSLVSCTGSGTLTYIADVQGLNQILDSFSYYQSAISVGSASLICVGNVKGGTRGNGYGGVRSAVGIRVGASGSVAITGNCESVQTVIESSTIYGSVWTEGGDVSITGTVTGNSFQDNTFQAAIYIQGSAIVTVNGDAVYGTSPPFAFNGAGGTVKLSGDLYIAGFPIASSIGDLRHLSGDVIFTSDFYTVDTDATQTITIESHDGSNAGTARTLSTAGDDQAGTADVRSGTSYNHGASVGTLAVPDPAYVSLGVDTDNTVGTLVPLNEATLHTALDNYTNKDNWKATGFATPTDVTDAAGTTDALITNAISGVAANRVERTTADTKPITFAWPASGATITATVSIDNSSYLPAAGALAFLKTEGGKHYYTLAFDAEDRPTEEGTARYQLTDGTYTRFLNLRIVDPADFKADTSGLQTSLDTLANTSIEVY